MDKSSNFPVPSESFKQLGLASHKAWVEGAKSLLFWVLQLCHISIDSYYLSYTAQNEMFFKLIPKASEQ